MEQHPVSTAAGLPVSNQQKILDFIREIEYSILDLISPADEEEYLSLDVATAQRSHLHHVPSMCFHTLRSAMMDALARPSLRHVGSLVSVLTIVLEGGVGIFGYTPTTPYPLVPSMKWYVLDVVEGINLVIERISRPQLYDGSAVLHLRDLARFCFLFNILLYDPVYRAMRSTTLDDPEGKTTFLSNIFMQDLVASMVFPLILQGAFFITTIELPITSCCTVAEMLGSSTERSCGVCLDAIEDEDDFWVLSSCRHVFCDRCAASWLLPRHSCPMCRAGTSYWISKSHLLEYQGYLDAGHASPPLDDDFFEQTEDCLKYLFRRF